MKAAQGPKIPPNNTLMADPDPRQTKDLPVPFDHRSCVMHGTLTERNTLIRVLEYFDKGAVDSLGKRKDAEEEKPKALLDGGYGGAST